MTTGFQTPGDQPNLCPHCGVRVRMTDSHLAGGAPCARCGVVLTYVVRDSEVYFVARDRARIETLQSAIAFESIDVGTRVRILDGAFENFAGTVTEVDRELQRVGVTIVISGRPTLVEVGVWELEAVQGGGGTV